MGCQIQPYWESLYVTNAYGKNPIVITLFNAPMTRERWWIAGFVFCFNLVIMATCLWGIVIWDRDYRKSLMHFERYGGFKHPLEFLIVGCLSYLLWFFAVMAFYAGGDIEYKSKYFFLIIIILPMILTFFLVKKTKQE